MGAEPPLPQAAPAPALGDEEFADYFERELEAAELVEGGAVCAAVDPRDADAVPLKLQGDLDHYPPHVQHARALHRRSARVEAMMGRFVASAARVFGSAPGPGTSASVGGGSSSFTKAAYVGLLRAVHNALQPADAVIAAELEADWRADADGPGMTTISAGALAEALFETVDIWCPLVTEASYVALLALLHECVFDEGPGSKSPGPGVPPRTVLRAARPSSARSCLDLLNSKCEGDIGPATIAQTYIDFGGEIVPPASPQTRRHMRIRTRSGAGSVVGDDRLSPAGDTGHGGGSGFHRLSASLPHRSGSLMRSGSHGAAAPLAATLGGGRLRSEARGSGPASPYIGGPSSRTRKMRHAERSTSSRRALTAPVAPVAESSDKFVMVDMPARNAHSSVWASALSGGAAAAASDPAVTAALDALRELHEQRRELAASGRPVSARRSALVANVRALIEKSRAGDVEAPPAAAPAGPSNVASAAVASPAGSAPAQTATAAATAAAKRWRRSGGVAQKSPHPAAAVQPVPATAAAAATHERGGSHGHRVSVARPAPHEGTVPDELDAAPLLPWVTVGDTVGDAGAAAQQSPVAGAAEAAIAPAAAAAAAATPVLKTRTRSQSSQSVTRAVTAAAATEVTVLPAPTTVIAASPRHAAAAAAAAAAVVTVVATDAPAVLKTRTRSQSSQSVTRAVAAATEVTVLPAPTTVIAAASPRPAAASAAVVTIVAAETTAVPTRLPAQRHSLRAQANILLPSSEHAAPVLCTDDGGTLSARPSVDCRDTSLRQPNTDAAATVSLTYGSRVGLNSAASSTGATGPSVETSKSDSGARTLTGGGDAGIRGPGGPGPSIGASAASVNPPSALSSGPQSVSELESASTAVPPPSAAAAAPKTAAVIPMLKILLQHAREGVDDSAHVQRHMEVNAAAAAAAAAAAKRKQVRRRRRSYAFEGAGAARWTRRVLKVRGVRPAPRPGSPEPGSGPIPTGRARLDTQVRAVAVGDAGNAPSPVPAQTRRARSGAARRSKGPGLPTSRSALATYTRKLEEPAAAAVAPSVSRQSLVAPARPQSASVRDRLGAARALASALATSTSRPALVSPQRVSPTERGTLSPQLSLVPFRLDIARAAMTARGSPRVAGVAAGSAGPEAASAARREEAQSPASDGTGTAAATAATTTAAPQSNRKLQPRPLLRSKSGGVVAAAATAASPGAAAAVPSAAAAKPRRTDFGNIVLQAMRAMMPSASVSRSALPFDAASRWRLLKDAVQSRSLLVLRHEAMVLDAPAPSGATHPLPAYRHPRKSVVARRLEIRDGRGTRVPAGDITSSHPTLSTITMKATE